MEEKRIIDINGMKMEVDLRTAKRIDTFKVGDNVKVLATEYNGTHSIKPGVITDFAMFKDLPTIVVAVFNEGGWSSNPTISFDTELIFASEEEIRLSRDGVIEKFEREIQKKENERQDLQNQLDYFKKHFLKNEGEVLADARAD